MCTFTNLYTAVHKAVRTTRPPWRALAAGPYRGSSSKPPSVFLSALIRLSFCTQLGPRALKLLYNVNTSLDEGNIFVFGGGRG